MIYTIYHIEDIKVGCTENIYLRSLSNKRKYGQDIKITILEEVDCPITADILEYYWHKELGYGKIKSCDRYMVRLKVGKSLQNREISDKQKKQISQTLKGKYPGEKNGNYGTGKIYIEYTTGFTGGQYDMGKRFNYSDNTITSYANRNTPIKKGPLKGLHFGILES